MYFRILLCTFCAGVLVRSQEDSPPSIRFRVQSFARERALITNPIAWVQLEDRVPEGSRVEKDQVVFTLDLEGTRDAIKNLEDRLETEGNRAAKEVADMEYTLQGLQDQRETLLDNRRIQQAKLTFLKSMPREEDIAIARGRVQVARERMQAEENNLATMKARLEKNFISPAQAQQAEWSYALQQAQTVYAEKMLEIARRPAREEEIQRVEFEIENLNLEIANLEKEIPTQEIILGIRQDTRGRQVANLEQELEEKKGELVHRELTAPRDGVLLYSTQLKRELTAGTKPSKGMVIGEIPEPDSIAFEGVIPEQTRHLFKEGDAVTLELNMYPGQQFEARLASMAPFSRDVKEDGDQPTGVKQVDVEIEILHPPDDLPIGVYGWATLVSGKPADGARVPISWVRYQGGKPHVSVKGRFQPVDGLLQGGMFFLTPPHPAVSDLQADGEWPEESLEASLDTGNRFTASGELLPLVSDAVTVPRVRAWDMKISWLYPENQRVEAGDLVARLDSQMVLDQIQERKERAERRTGDRESTEQQLELNRSQRDLQLASATNSLQIARLNRELVLTRDRDEAIAKATLDLETAKIRLASARADQERAQRTPELTAAAEIERRDRDVQRRELAVRQAEIQVELAKIVSSDRERSLAFLQTLRAEAKLADVEARFHRDLSRLQSSLQWQTRRERRDRNRLREAEDQLESLNLSAPVDGLLKYEKIWDGVRRSKTRTGLRVYPGNALLSLSSTTEVYVEVPLPERYVDNIHLGMAVQVVIPSEGNLQWRGSVTAYGKILEPARPDIRPGSMFGNQEMTREQILPVRVVVESGAGQTLKPGAVAQLIFPFEK